MNKKRTGRFIALALLLAGLCSTAQAVVVSRANANTNLDQTAAWSSGVLPGTNDIANFTNLGNQSRSNALGKSTAWLGMSIPGNQGRDFILSTSNGTEVLTLGSAGIDMTNLLTTLNQSATINVKVDLGASQTWGVAGAVSTNLQRNLLVNGVISGASGNTLTKSGGGSLTLTAANTYSGGTILSGGLLNISNATSLGSGTLTMAGGTLSSLANLTNANTISLNSDGTVGALSGKTLNLFGAITNSGNLIINDQGTVVLNGTNSYGATVINSGTLQVSAKTGAGTLGTGNVTNNGVLAFNRTAALNVANNISGTGSVQTVGSSTALITLSGNNTYSGETRATSGVGSGFAVTSDSNLGTGTNIYIGQNARLQVNGDMATGKNIQMAGANPLLDVAADKTLTLNGIIYGASASPRKDVGTGTLILNGANQFADKSVFLIQTGTLKLGNAAALNGTTLKFNGVTTLDNVTGTDNLAPTGLQGLELTTGFTYTGTKSLDLSGVSAGFVQTSNTVRNINVVANRLTIGGIRATGTNYAGTALLDGSLTKSGLGTLEIKGNSDFTNVTLITAGELIVNGSLASKQVTVNAGGTLGGTGAFQSVTVDAGGILSAGNSPGIMTFDGALTLSAGSTNIMEIVSASMYDVLKGNGANALTMNGETVFDFTGWTGGVTNGFSIVLSDMFQNWSSTNYTGATFAAKGLGGTQSLDFTGGVLTVIPEPATIGMLGLGALITLMLRRVRRTH